jgi:hypothetical protein
MRRLITLVILLSTYPVYAATLATGMAGTVGGVDCFIANVGTKPVTVSSVTIIDGDGTAASIGANNCTFPGQIAPGLTCRVSAIVNSGMFGNIVRLEVVTSSKSSIRATMETLSSTDVRAVLEAH